MKICVVSDTHDNYQMLEAAIGEAVVAGAEVVLHAGDVVAPSTLKVFRKFDLPVHVIHGNNSGDLYMLARITSDPQNHLTYYGQDAGIELAGRRIFMVHYPHYAEAMATTGDWDIVCCGHSHKPVIKTIKNMHNKETIFLNPGTTGGVGSDPATYILGDLETLEFTLHTLAE